MDLSEEQWKARLAPEQYRVLRQKGTEYPGTGKLLGNTRTGEYFCTACDQLLFTSGAKYKSDQIGLEGWPSFADPAGNNAVELRPDLSLGMPRTEVVCKNCGGHLGHVFDDPSSPSGVHYCVNSVSLDFKETDKA